MAVELEAYIAELERRAVAEEAGEPVDEPLPLPDIRPALRRATWKILRDRQVALGRLALQKVVYFSSPNRFVSQQAAAHLLVGAAEAARSPPPGAGAEMRAGAGTKRRPC